MFPDNCRGGRQKSVSRTVARESSKQAIVPVQFTLPVVCLTLIALSSLAKREQALAQMEAQVGDDLASVDRSQAALEAALDHVRDIERNLSPAQVRTVRDAEAIPREEKARIYPIRDRFELMKEEQGR